MCELDLLIGGLTVSASLIIGFTGFLVLTQIVKKKRIMENGKS